jgi:hypothetical protein
VDRPLVSPRRKAHAARRAGVPLPVPPPFGPLSVRAVCLAGAVSVRRDSAGRRPRPACVSNRSDRHTAAGIGIACARWCRRGERPCLPGLCRGMRSTTVTVAGGLLQRGLLLVLRCNVDGLAHDRRRLSCTTPATGSWSRQGRAPSWRRCRSTKASTVKAWCAPALRRGRVHDARARLDPADA